MPAALRAIPTGSTATALWGPKSVKSNNNSKSNRKSNRKNNCKNNCKSNCKNNCILD